jgi:hypothetical protein
MKEYSSYPSYKKVMPNLILIREHGIGKLAVQQRRRIKLLETMVADFDDGRSKSFYCKSAALLDLTTLEKSLDRAIQEIETDNINPNDTRTKAKILKGILGGTALISSM